MTDVIPLRDLHLPGKHGILPIATCVSRKKFNIKEKTMQNIKRRFSENLCKKYIALPLIALLSLPLVAQHSIPGEGSSNSGPTVYIAGIYWEANTYVYKACYWKNGVHIPLSSERSTASSIVVENGSVYVAGSNAAKACYWKDGVQTTLFSGQSVTSAITVTNGTVYVAGAIGGDKDNIVGSAC